MAKEIFRTKRIKVSSPYAKELKTLPNFHKSGSIIGMKKQCYGKSAKLVICGSYIYNTTGVKEMLYHNIAY